MKLQKQLQKFVYQTSLLSRDISKNCALKAAPGMSTAFTYRFVFNQEFNGVKIMWLSFIDDN
jgi:hypothetical protein